LCCFLFIIIIFKTIERIHYNVIVDFLALAKSRSIVIITSSISSTFQFSAFPPASARIVNPEGRR
jgi:hypothetical protein